jgi:FAD/FMN-containing dehydrogenase
LVPETGQAVAGALSILSANSGCDFAIKGQSHMPAAGFANINGGITIDMTKLKSVSLNKDHSVASVGSGAKWLDAYTYLDQFNVTVAGGRNGLVGVGGLTLGGGISYFGPRVGWACDNVVNYEVILFPYCLANRVLIQCRRSLLPQVISST